MSVRRYILIPMLVIIIICSFTTTMLFIRYFTNGLYNTAHDKVEIAVTSVYQSIEDLKRPARLATAIVAANDKLAYAVSEREHSFILSSAHEMMELANTDFCTILDNEGTVLARTHEPEIHGDSLAYQHSIKQALNGTHETTIEPGTVISLSVRSASPIHDEDRNVLGVVSLGYRFDTPEFGRLLKEATGCEVFIYRGNECISSTLMDETNCCIMCTSPEVIDLVAKTANGETFFGEIDMNGRGFLVNFVPITGPYDEIVGVIGVGDFWRENNEQLENIRITGIILAIILLVLGTIISVVVTIYIDRKLNTLMRTIRDTSKNRDAVLEAIDSMIVITTIESDEIIYVNKKMKESLGFDKSVIGDNCWKHFNKDTNGRCGHCPKLKPEFYNGESIVWEYHNPHVDRMHRITSRILDWPDGSKVMIEQVDDITDIKRAAREIQKAGETKSTLAILGSILDGIDMHIYVSDPDSGELLFVNKRLLAFFGMENENLIGKHCYDVFRGFKEMCQFCPCIELNKNPNQVITWSEHLDSHDREILHNDCYIDWPDGKKVHLQSAIDITDMKKTQSELEHQNMRLNLLISGMNLGLWDSGVNPDRIQEGSNEHEIYWSDELRRLFGYTDESDFPNKVESWLEIIHPDDRQMIVDSIDAFFNDKTGRTPYNVEYRLRVKTGEYKWFRSFGNCLRDEHGNPIQTVGATENITSRKETEIEIAEKNEQLEHALYNAESANKAKSAFLANMSHEIRTPMNAILGITEIQLRDENLKPELMENLEMIYESGSLLLNIINDILDLSKIEAGKLELIPVKYDMPSLINDTVSLNRMRYENKPIEFVLNIDAATPINLFGDELRIKQILNNILSNAFKYTDNGKITMSVNIKNDIARDPADNSIVIVYTVSDTGQGMTQEQIGLLFNEYKRFNMEANRTTIGTGLGMSIAKKLIDLMEGEITVESQVGKGSVFKVSIPQKRLDEAVFGNDLAEKLCTFKFQSTAMMTKSHMIREYMPYGSVLIVDDVESNIYVTKGMLLPYGLNIESVTSGFAAIDKIKEGRKYDMILLDHMMPRMDGIETIKILRSEYNYNGTIVALTANALVGHAEMFMQNGFDGYISKPIDSRELNQLLNEFIRNKQPAEVIDAARRKHAMSSPVKSENKAQAAAMHPDEPFLPVDPQDFELDKLIADDLRRTITALENINLDNIESDDSILDEYEVAVHGIKSALRNVGENELSEFARNLEEASRQYNLEMIRDETPVLMTELKIMYEKYRSQ